MLLSNYSSSLSVDSIDLKDILLLCLVVLILGTFLVILGFLGVELFAICSLLSSYWILSWRLESSFESKSTDDLWLLSIWLSSVFEFLDKFNISLSRIF